MSNNLYDNVNITELVSIIAELGFQVNPLLPKERLIEIIRGSDPTAAEISPLLDMRLVNRETLNEHWHSLQLQLVTTCKGKCREEGSLCPDMMVLLCNRRMSEMRKHRGGKSRTTKTFRIAGSPESA
jgi:hypothetical protein